MNIRKILMIVGSIFVINCVFATNSQLNLTSINNQDLLSITLNVANLDTIKNVKFHGLESIPVSNREVFLNTSSNNKQSNRFKTTLLLTPVKPQTISVYVTAEVNGKKLTSNIVKVTVTESQIKKFQQKQKKQAELDRQKIKKIQKHINDQIKAQQEFFDDINTFMKKQHDEILKEQKEFLKNFDI